MTDFDPARRILLKMTAAAGGAIAARPLLPQAEAAAVAQPAAPAAKDDGQEERQGNVR